MSNETPLGRYAFPSPGDKKWNRQNNGDAPGPEDIWAQQEIEITDEVETFDDLPDSDASLETDEGQRRRILVRESRVIYRDTGSGWSPIAGLGSEAAPVPEPAYFEHVEAVDVFVLPVYETESDLPEDPDDGQVAFVKDAGDGRSDIYYPDTEDN